MTAPGKDDEALMTFVQAIVADDESAFSRLLGTDPTLASAAFESGATRQTAESYYFKEIEAYAYAGDTALHMAAAAYRAAMVRTLVEAGADVRARNRLGAEPLHGAAKGIPGSHTWDPDAQAATIACLIDAGADPNAVDGRVVTPLHRAVRTRCAAAVKALLASGADVEAPNKSGSTPMMLATRNTGRGGTGSAAAKDQHAEILRLLTEHGAKPR